MRKRSSWQGAFVAAVLAVIVASAPSLLFAASNYGADTYGGGAFGQGEAPVAAPAAPTGGGVISGPLSVGYTAPATTTTIGSTTIAISGGQFATDVSSSSLAIPYQFTRSLQYLHSGPDVRRLQKFLNTHGSLLASEDDGSPGNETDFFGVLTYRALVRFQNAHPDEILKPSGLIEGTGFFGPNTRAYVNTLSNR